MIVFNCSQAFAEFIEPRKAGPAPFVGTPASKHPGEDAPLAAGVVPDDAAPWRVAGPPAAFPVTVRLRDPETGEQLRLVTRTALSSQELGPRMEGVVADIIMGAVATGATPASHAVTEAAWGQLLGVAIARYLLQVPSLADLAFDDLVEMIGPGVQATLEREVSISPRQ